MIYTSKEWSPDNSMSCLVRGVGSLDHQSLLIQGKQHLNVSLTSVWLSARFCLRVLCSVFSNRREILQVPNRQQRMASANKRTPVWHTSRSMNQSGDIADSICLWHSFVEDFIIWLTPMRCARDAECRLWIRDFNTLRLRWPYELQDLSKIQTRQIFQHVFPEDFLQ